MEHNAHDRNVYNLERDENRCGPESQGTHLLRDAHIPTPLFYRLHSGRRGRENLDVQGFKIGLELMVRCNCKKVIDVPITFQDREAGESKLSAKVYIYYIIQLIKLYIHAYFWLLILLVCMVIGLLAKVAGVF